MNTEKWRQKRVRFVRDAMLREQFSEATHSVKAGTHGLTPGVVEGHVVVMVPDEVAGPALLLPLADADRVVKVMGEIVVDSGDEGDDHDEGGEG
jgi:hypothetical protein